MYAYPMMELEWHALRSGAVPPAAFAAKPFEGLERSKRTSRSRRVAIGRS